MKTQLEQPPAAASHTQLMKTQLEQPPAADSQLERSLNGFPWSRTDEIAADIARAQSQSRTHTCAELEQRAAAASHTQLMKTLLIAAICIPPAWRRHHSYFTRLCSESCAERRQRHGLPPMLGA